MSDIIDNTDGLLSEIDREIHEKLTKSVLVVERKAKQPGVCPRKTGHLARSITHDVKGNTGVVGTNVEYAPHVELGTVKMAARPYLRTGLMYLMGIWNSIWNDK